MHSASCLIAFSHAGNGCYPDLWIAPYANGKFPLADVSASGSLVHQSDVWNGAFLRRDLYLVNMLNWKCVEGVQNSRATLCLLVSENSVVVLNPVTGKSHDFSSSVCCLVEHVAKSESTSLTKRYLL